MHIETDDGISVLAAFIALFLFGSVNGNAAGANPSYTAIETVAAGGLAIAAFALIRRSIHKGDKKR